MSRIWRQQNPRVTPDEQRFTEFTGTVNTRSRKDIGLSALYASNNVVISDTKKVVRRDGYSILRSGNVRSAYSCGGRLYIVDGSSLYHMASAVDLRLLVSGLTGTDYHWDDINGDVYFTNGVEAGICRGDAYLPWRLTVPTITNATLLTAGPGSSPAFNMGATYTDALFRICATYETADGRESAPSPVVELRGSPLTNLIRVEVPTGYARTHCYATTADGAALQHVAGFSTVAATFDPTVAYREFDAFGTSSLPEGAAHIAFFQGRCYAARYLSSVGQTVVWFSKPLAFHLWDLANDYLLLPGQLGIMLANNGGLLLGTTHKIYQYTEEGALSTLADYGVVPGTAGDTDAEGVAYFWTERGFCRAMPFEALSEKDVMVNPGMSATAGFVYHNGLQQFVTITRGVGETFNARSERS